MRVLLLGDSHTHGSYGQALEALFKKAGHTVTRVGWVSAAATHYLSGGYKKLKLGHTGDFDSDVKGKEFDIAIVSLGTNDAGGTTSDSSAAAAVAKIKQLADSIKASKVYWVGPPSFHPEAARKYNKAYATDDLNTKVARIWAAGSRVFPNAIDPRAATKDYVGTMAPTAKLPGGDIHFQKAGGAAWAQYVFGVVTGGGMPALTGSSVKPIPSAGEQPGKGGFPWKIALLVAIGGGYLWWRRRR